MSRWSRRTQFSSLGGAAGESAPPPALGAVGLPTDGSWTDGLVSIQEGEIIENVLDDMNELLVYLAPPSPPLIVSATLTSNISLYSGKIPSGLSGAWSNAGSPGATQSSVGLSNSVILTVGPFGPADKGTITLYKNNVSLAILDIAASFQTSMRSSNQNLSAWDYQGSGSPITDGIITFSGGTLEVVSCGIYNDFPAWQAMTLRVTFTSSLTDGEDAVRLTHAHDSGSQSKSWTVFYDSDTTPLSFAVTPAVVETAPQYRWLSGIRYYTTGSQFSVAFTGSNCFRQTYHTTQVGYYSMPGLSTVTKNPSSAPSVGANFVISDTFVTLNASNVTSINGRLTAGLRDPYGSNVTSQSASENRLIHTYSTQATEKADYFLDEYYRLPLGDYDSVPSPIYGVWTSSTALTNGNPQCWNTGLRYPTVNFTSGYLPTQAGRNYSTFTGPQTYIRSFRDSSIPHNSVTLTMPGTSVSPHGSGLNVFVKLPGQTGWLDVGTMFSPGDFTGADNDGCLVSKSGSQYSITFGTFDTSHTSWLIMVKVVLNSTSDYLTSIVTNW